MCYGKKISLVAWIIGYALGFSLLKRGKTNDTWLGIFVLTFTTIQLLEAGIWHAIETKNKKLNDMVSRLILLGLWMQPIVLMYGAFKYGNAKDSLLMQWVAALLVIPVIHAIGRILNTGYIFQSNAGPNGHLVWRNWDQSGSEQHFLGGRLKNWSKAIYFAGLGLPFLTSMQPTTQSLPLLAFGFATFVYNSFKFSDTGEFSTMWCFVSVGFGLAAWLSGTGN